jgi:hypothetical protein
MEALANPIRHTLSILQFWLEKRLGELAQFKTRLQFRRAHRLGEPTFNKLHPRSMTSNAWTQRPSKSLPAWRSVYFHPQGMVMLMRRYPKGP